MWRICFVPDAYSHGTEASMLSFLMRTCFPILNDAENVHEANGVDTKRLLIEVEGLVLVTNFHLLLMMDAREIHRVAIDDVYLLDGARFG